MAETFVAMKGKAKSLIVIMLVMMFSTPALACLNSYSEVLGPLFTERDTVRLNQEVSRLAALYKKSPSVEVANDYAVGLIYIGEFQTAISVLEDLESSNPGAYRTAANLGTVYELVGSNHAALEWINEGIKRNLDDHEGTEWLHVKILEAKLALTKDSQWLSKHSVLGLGGNAQSKLGQTKLIDASGRTRDAADIERALMYQLAERVKFVPPPDAIVGDLFLSWGDIGAMYEDSELLFDRARLYAPDRSREIDKRVSAIPWYFLPLILLPLLFLFIFLARFIWVRLRRIEAAP